MLVNSKDSLHHVTQVTVEHIVQSSASRMKTSVRDCMLLCSRRCVLALFFCSLPTR
jgi:hypothetical protein